MAVSLVVDDGINAMRTDIIRAFSACVDISCKAFVSTALLDGIAIGCGVI